MPSAAETLDAIRFGAQEALLNAHRRLADCGRALERGDFSEALMLGGQLMDRLQSLAQANEHLGMLAGTRVVTTDEVAVGMRAPGEIAVVSVEPCPCPVVGCRKVIVTFDNGVVIQMLPGMELAILREDD